MPEAVITGGARTAIGRLLGSLKDLAATDLGGIVIKAALDRSGVTGSDVQYVIMGQVLQAGAGQIPSRQAAVAAGIPMTVPSITINKVCLSGLDAIALAAQLIRAGEFDIVVAGGMESMTKAPHLLPGARAGHKYGAMELLDAMALDGLTDPFEHIPMGELTDAHNKRLGIGRAEQDDFAALSHQRAAAAIKDGLLNDEIVAVPVPQRRGDPVLFDTDEGVRGETTAESLARLRPAFDRVVVQGHAPDAAVLGEHPGLGPDLLGRENAAYRGQRRITVEQVEVSRQLLDPVNFTAPLDLDGHGRRVLVPAHQVHRADRGRVLPADQPPALAEQVHLRGEQFLQVRLDAVLLQPRIYAKVMAGVVQHLFDRDAQLLAALAHHPPGAL